MRKLRVLVLMHDATVDRTTNGAGRVSDLTWSDVRTLDAAAKFREGQHDFGSQRVPLGYNGLLGYNALPYDLRNHYGPQLDPYSRYIYDRNYIYRVDPRTMLVQQVLNAILR